MYLTLYISGIAIVAAVTVSPILAALQAKRVTGLRWLVVGFVNFIRNTPFPLQLVFYYFGLPSLGVHLSPMATGIIGLSIYGTAYMTENIRGGFDGIPVVQTEAAYALGFGKISTLIGVELPAATRRSIHASTNTIIAVLKDSSLVYFISVPELTYTTMSLMGRTYRTVELFAFLGVAYLTMVFCLIGLLKLYERSLRLEESI